MIIRPWQVTSNFLFISYYYPHTLVGLLAFLVPSYHGGLHCTVMWLPDTPRGDLTVIEQNTEHRTRAQHADPATLHNTIASSTTSSPTIVHSTHLWAERIVTILYATILLPRTAKAEACLAGWVQSWSLMEASMEASQYGVLQIDHCLLLYNFSRTKQEQH